MTQEEPKVGCSYPGCSLQGLCLSAGKKLVVCSGAWQGATAASALLHTALVGEPGEGRRLECAQRPERPVRAQGSGGRSARELRCNPETAVTTGDKPHLC